jgi:preprotein translocase subunit SecA
VEAQHFEIRKHLLQYDDVMNKQRIFFYGLRTEILKGNTREYVLRVAGEVAEGLVHDHLPPKGEKDVEGLRERVEQLYAMSSGLDLDALAAMPQADATRSLAESVRAAYEDKERRLGSGDVLRWHERIAILQIIDSAWKRHLLVMDHLKEAIGFRGYGQKDPLVEYKRESYDYFENMRFGYEDEIISYLYRVEPQAAADGAAEPPPPPRQKKAKRREAAAGEDGPARPVRRVTRFSAGGVE